MKGVSNFKEEHRLALLQTMGRQLDKSATASLSEYCETASAVTTKKAKKKMSKNCLVDMSSDVVLYP